MIPSQFKINSFEDMWPTTTATKDIPVLFEKNALPPVLGFFGEKGLGKTSLAHLVYRMVNCETNEPTHPCNICKNCIKYHEGYRGTLYDINAAADGGKENTIELINKMSITLYSSLVKNNHVFIIDEAHGLTKQAQSSILKFLDELVSTSGNIMYLIFCTDRPDALSDPLLSRITSYNFKPLTTECSIEKAIKIAEMEGETITTEVAEQIAKLSEGTPRLIVEFTTRYIHTGNLPNTSQVAVARDVQDILPFIRHIIKYLLYPNMRTQTLKELPRVKSDFWKLLTESNPESIRIKMINFLSGAMARIAPQKDNNNKATGYNNTPYDVMKAYYLAIKAFDSTTYYVPTEKANVMNMFMSIFFTE